MEFPPGPLADASFADPVSLGDHGRRCGLCRGLAAPNSGQPGPDVRLGIPFSQAVQAEGPLASRRRDGGVLDVLTIFNGTFLPLDLCLMGKQSS